MDWGSFVAGALSGLIVGVLVGRNNDLLARLRFRDEQKYFDNLDTLDRSVRMFNARVEYVTRAMSGPGASSEAKQAYLTLYRDDVHARPEGFVPDEVWSVWMAAEEGAKDRDRSPRDRRTEITRAQEALLEWFASERKRLLK